MVHREEMYKEIVTLLFSKARETSSEGNNAPSFGLLMGPPGTGKSVLVTYLCNKYPEGVLYLEVGKPLTFPYDLAKEVGMN